MKIEVDWLVNDNISASQYDGTPGIVLVLRAP